MLKRPFGKVPWFGYFTRCGWWKEWYRFAGLVGCVSGLFPVYFNILAFWSHSYTRDRDTLYPSSNGDPALKLQICSADDLDLFFSSFCSRSASVIPGQWNWAETHSRQIVHNVKHLSAAELCSFLRKLEGSREEALINWKKRASRTKTKDLFK